ncbi:MAG: L-threonylcarbamoyladenylate synthase [Candidatus Gastranaerophilaceae bacterium]
MKISNDKEFVEKLNQTLKNGGVIAFVTDTVWGIGCLPDNKAGVDKIYKLKQRDMSKPLILMSDKKEKLYPYVQNIPVNAKSLMETHFPGALTVILERSEKTPSFITSNKDTVGIRVPANKTFQKLCSLIDGGVLATTSANLSGQSPALTYKSAVKNIGQLVDIILEDEDEKATGEPSTVAGVSENEIIIFRQGKVRI